MKTLTPNLFTQEPIKDYSRANVKALLSAISARRDHTRLFGEHGARTHQYTPEACIITEYAHCQCGSMAESCDDGERAWLQCSCTNPVEAVA
jgi:hypothetical protein